MSFSAGVKGEILREFPQNHCCALAEAYGILLFCNRFSGDEIRIVTENREFAAFLPKLFSKAFGFSFDMMQEPVNGGKVIYSIFEPEKLDYILDCCGLAADEILSISLNLPVIEEDCCKAAFFRGAFLAGGSVTDPAKGYHLELATTHNGVSGPCYLSFYEVMGFYPKTTSRSGNSVLYLKQSEQIADFLTYLGASLSAMSIMEARLEKEMNNKINRRVNCDDHNISKVVDAAQEQLAAIRILEEQGRVDALPQKLQQALEARKANPESSLTELAAMMVPPITKPSMNHRLKKLVELAKEKKE